MPIAALGSAFLLLGFAGIVAAAMPNAKVGLWESTTTTVIEAGLPANFPDAARMPPEQRAKIQRSLSPTGGKPTTLTERMCVSPEMLERWDGLAKAGSDSSDCRRTVMEQTAQHVRLALVCGGGKSTGEMEFNATGSDRVAAKLTLLVRGDRSDSKVNLEMHSRFLGTECGGLKPGERMRVGGG